VSGTVIRYVGTEVDRLVCDPTRGGCGATRPVPHGQTVVQSVRQSGHTCGDDDWSIPDHKPRRKVKA
jgi:hypothetical protein